MNDAMSISNIIGGTENSAGLQVHGTHSSRRAAQAGYNGAMLDKKLDSLRNALTGLLVAWREEFNFRFQAVCGVLALGAAWVLGISYTELLVIILLIGFVLAAEALNTALEAFCDMVKSDPDPHIGKIKDLAAAAVLISSLTALIIGSIIFIPRILLLL